MGKGPRVVSLVKRLFSFLEDNVVSLVERLTSFLEDNVLM